MILSHHAQNRRGTAGRRSSGEPGYVMVMFALLLVPLLLMAGLAVDIGGWYSRASDIQKAADAAALAGVVWLPDVAKATQYANEAATRNGFTDGVNGVDIVVAPVPGTTRQLRVTITDPNVGSFFFAKLGGKKISLSRSGTGEYIFPVPLGSPENRFGTDPTLPAAQQAGLWGNIHGSRTDNFKGDAYSPFCRGGDNCTGSSNPWVRTSGYLYAIDVPANMTDMYVQVYDGGMYPRANETIDTGDAAFTGTGSTTTTWTMYDRDLTELDVSDNPTAASTSLCNNGSGRWNLGQGVDAAVHQNKWASICSRTGTITPGRYLLRVQTSGDGSGANRYAVRVLSGSTVKPRIAAYGDMSMYNNISGDNAQAQFYLAEVDPIHKGKTLEIRLYDPGEVGKSGCTTVNNVETCVGSGSGVMKVIAPGGSVAASCTGIHDGGAGGGRFTSGTDLTPCQFTTSSGSESARFNGDWVTLQIDLPTTYSCTMGTVPGCWWKIQYNIDGQGNDTTTWAAQIIGDPVHLVES